MVDIEDYKATLDSKNKQLFETLEQRWFHIERCNNLLDMHLDPTIRTKPTLIEDEARLLLAMGDCALPNPYTEENPHVVRLPVSMCMSVTEDEAGMSKICERGLRIPSRHQL
jgi:hypothetical protein